MLCNKALSLLKGEAGNCTLFLLLMRHEMVGNVSDKRILSM